MMFPINSIRTNKNKLLIKPLTNPSMQKFQGVNRGWAANCKHIASVETNTLSTKGNLSLKQSSQDRLFVSHNLIEWNIWRGRWRSRSRYRRGHVLCNARDSGKLLRYDRTVNEPRFARTRSAILINGFFWTPDVAQYCTSNCLDFLLLLFWEIQ